MTTVNGQIAEYQATGVSPADVTAQAFAAVSDVAILITGVRPLASNQMVVLYSGDIDPLKAYEPDSPLRLSNWTVTPLDPGARARRVQRVEYVGSDDPRVLSGYARIAPRPFLILSFDGPLTEGARYRVDSAV